MASNGQEAPFDIVANYKSLLSSDADLTMPVAAIESLVHLLAATPSLTTVSETLDVLEKNITKLKAAIPNAISLSAGTDLFMRYIVTALRPGANDGADFESVRQHLLSNAKVFVSRAKDARRAIALQARRFVRQGNTVLTTGGSRAVLSVLQEAASAQTRSSGAPRFNVIYVSGSYSGASESAAAVASLRALSVPVAVIPESAIAYSMSKVTMAIVGAEGVVESGGIISRLGTYQLALLVKTMSKPVYVVAESHKFVRMFPLGQFDIGVKQDILAFSAEEGAPTATQNGGKTGEGVAKEGTAGARADAVDYTPPEYITALITETGVLTTSAVSEELIKMWN